MSRFKKVKEILDRAVGGPATPVNAPHGDFWRAMSRDEFVAFSFLSLELIVVSDGNASNLIKSLRGEAPFGRDLGTPGAFLNRMPSGMPPVADGDVELIREWIDDGCPDDDVGDGAGELSFNTDIRPLFRSSDIDAMKGFGFDLSKYDDVKEHAERIHERLADGTMPCDGAWPAERIETFRRWIDEGMRP